MCQFCQIVDGTSCELDFSTGSITVCEVFGPNHGVSRICKKCRKKVVLNDNQVRLIVKEYELDQKASYIFMINSCELCDLTMLVLPGGEYYEIEQSKTATEQII